ncbi:hypothetical protein [Symbioplanes lichenis]|uniref:hypothetical protein n=1 Tax=Symbioplanes lichenis TaxID=1629072 RepID=UPI002738B255|nr:hypothetical protein [Actinoplanes lichenis]
MPFLTPHAWAAAVPGADQTVPWWLAALMVVALLVAPAAFWWQHMRAEDHIAELRIALDSCERALAGAQQAAVQAQNVAARAQVAAARAQQAVDEALTSQQALAAEQRLVSVVVQTLRQRQDDAAEFETRHYGPA